MRKNEMKQELDRLIAEREQLARELVDVTIERDRLRDAARDKRPRARKAGELRTGRFRPKSADRYSAAGTTGDD